MEKNVSEGVLFSKKWVERDRRIAELKEKFLLNDTYVEMLVLKIELKRIKKELKKLDQKLLQEEEFKSLKIN